MKRSCKQLIAILSVLAVLSTMTMLITIASEVDDDLIPEEATELIDDNFITSNAAIVIEYDTGLVIHEFNADELRVPASMTKMAAVYVVFDAISEGIVSLDTVIQISESASAFSYVRAYSNVPMPENSSYTVSQLLDVVIVRSASSSTIALGEGVFGSEAAMVAKMNEKAKQLGIIASFYDSWGGSPSNRISARGMAEMTRALINDYPEVLDFTSQGSVMFDDISYSSTNLLIGVYEGIDGFKTGFTNPAGWCFTGTAIQGGRRIITVTMGSVQGYRFTDSVVLLDYGFANYGHIIANHFRSALHPFETDNFADTTLVPIMMYDIDMAQNLHLRDIAIILNESKPD